MKYNKYIMFFLLGILQVSYIQSAQADQQYRPLWVKENDEWELRQVSEEEFQKLVYDRYPNEPDQRRETALVGYNFDPKTLTVALVMPNKEGNFPPVQEGKTSFIDDQPRSRVDNNVSSLRKELNRQNLLILGLYAQLQKQAAFYPDETTLTLRREVLEDVAELVDLRRVFSSTNFLSLSQNVDALKTEITKLRAEESRVINNFEQQLSDFKLSNSAAISAAIDVLSQEISKTIKGLESEIQLLKKAIQSDK